MPPRCFQRALHRLAEAGGIVGWCEKQKLWLPCWGYSRLKAQRGALRGGRVKNRGTPDDKPERGKSTWQILIHMAACAWLLLTINHLAHWQMGESVLGGLSDMKGWGERTRWSLSRTVIVSFGCFLQVPKRTFCWGHGTLYQLMWSRTSGLTPEHKTRGLPDVEAL